MVMKKFLEKNKNKSFKKDLKKRALEDLRHETLLLWTVISVLSDIIGILLKKKAKS